MWTGTRWTTNVLALMPTRPCRTGSDNEMGLDTLYDALQRSQWMAMFEMSCSVSDMDGMRQQLETLPEDCPFDPVGLDEPEDRDLCPEWMSELRLEGWDSSTVQTYEEHYAIGA
ncbi:hypothetical protein JVT61DRAFT_4923 [Boletus reticuloceps]|uniref:Uncharacterized protein n=1 Tax=Boletus reticuloceps TaxID=495285 RepID=A0A8I2YXY5_9AGAM|nr:hypothetical protein JVT61DRAFT_4923 [Boletus reticuloceps]